MQGKIEFHGAKQMLVDGPSLTQIESNNYIPGDIVYMYTDKTSFLVYRRAQAVIGITKECVNGKSVLYIPNFGPTCKFSPILDLDSDVGTKFVLWLCENGSVELQAQYSADAVDDVKALLHMYVLEQTRPVPSEQKGTPLYTTDAVVNHEDLDTFTIDPTSSVDFDDALSVDFENNTVYIHIVDIAAYENLNPNLWTRCLTLYMANEHTEHLLDAEDASLRLSLVAGLKRPVITVKVALDEGGLVKHYEIYKSTIVVKKRWDYSQVQAALDADTAPAPIVYLANLTKLRSADVNYNINLPSVRIEADKATGEVIGLKTENTNDAAHTLVATAMILGNLVVSKHLSDSGVVIPNRFHDSLRGFSTPSFKPTGNTFVDSFIMVKRYARAYYSVDQKGHFGLGIKDYVHFTSPMRRYADVLVHRLLAGFNYDDLDYEVDWLNRRAIIARTAQDLYTSWKTIRWLKTLPGTHEIWVTNVSKAGIMWFMPALSLNGFLHVTELAPTQYWHFENDMLNGKTTGDVIKLGQKLTAQVKNIDTVTSSVSLSLPQ
jgi:ribonuclease R